MNKPRCLIVFFDNINRAVKCTWPNIDQYIVQPLKKNFDCKIHVFNLKISEDEKMDGVYLDNNDQYIIPADTREEKTRDQVKIDPAKKDYVFSHYIDEGRGREKPVIDQLYSEWHTGNFIEKNKERFDVVVALRSVIMPLRDINIRHVIQSMSDNKVYTGKQWECGGYTDGFYFGAPKLVSIVLKRAEQYDPVKNRPHNFESYLKYFMEQNNIQRGTTDIIWVKLTSMGKIKKSYQNIDKIVSKEEANRILNKIKELDKDTKNRCCTSKGCKITKENYSKPPQNNKGLNVWLLILILIIVMVLTVIFICIYCLFRKNR